MVYSSLSKKQARRIKYAIVGLSAILLTSFLWSCMVPVNQADLTSNTSRTKTHHLDIVIAHYSEPPAEVQESIRLIKNIPLISALSPRVIVYTKGAASTTTDADLKAFKKELGADILRTLPNRGRESGTYLSHIIDHYDELARHTLFVQATLDIPHLTLRRLSTHFTPNVGVLSLNNYTTCSCDSCRPVVYHGSPDPVYGFKRIPQLYSIFNEHFCPPEGLLLTFKGQFVVSRNRILRAPKKKYFELFQVLDNMSHFVHGDPKKHNDMTTSITSKTPENPMFGHTLERSWMVIFGCNDVEMAVECPDLDVQSVAAQCACLDV